MGGSCSGCSCFAGKEQYDHTAGPRPIRKRRSSRPHCWRSGNARACIRASARQAGRLNLTVAHWRSGTVAASAARSSGFRPLRARRRRRGRLVLRANRRPREPPAEPSAGSPQHFPNHEEAATRRAVYWPPRTAPTGHDRSRRPARRPTLTVATTACAGNQVPRPHPAGRSTHQELESVVPCPAGSADLDPDDAYRLELS